MMKIFINGIHSTALEMKKWMRTENKSGKECSKEGSLIIEQIRDENDIWNISNGFLMG